MADWADTTHSNIIRVYDVDPHTLAVRQEIQGVELSSSNLTWGYYTDTRTSGSLQVKDSNHIAHSLIRIIYSIPEWNYSRTLGTYVVTNDDSERNKGSWITTYELHSALTMIEKDYIPCHYVAGKGGKAKDLMSKMIKGVPRPFYFLDSAKDYTFKENKIYELGDSVLSDIFDMCDLSNNYLNVDGNGYITIGAYANPSTITSSWNLSVTDSKTLLLDGISRSSDHLSMPTRAIVTYKGSEQYKEGETTKTRDVEIVAYADATSGETRAARGYEVAEVHTLQNLDPTTKAAAQSWANKYLTLDHTPSYEWTIKSLYMPMEIGQTCTITFPDGPDKGSHHCLIKTISTSLDYLDLSITLKEV